MRFYFFGHPVFPTFAILPYPLHIQSVTLPDGAFDLYMPIPEKVTEFFLFLQNQNADNPSPYWARLWPSAIGLASFIRQHPGLVAGKKVAELAAGLGLPSLVAATYSKNVWCSDSCAEAMEVAAQSASLHHLNNIQFEACNWNNLPAGFDAEVVLLSDVNYNPATFPELEMVLLDLLRRGCTLILSTPQRLMAKPFIEKLLPFVVEQTVLEVLLTGQPAMISIFVMRKT